MSEPPQRTQAEREAARAARNAARGKPAPGGDAAASAPGGRRPLAGDLAAGPGAPAPGPAPSSGSASSPSPPPPAPSPPAEPSSPPVSPAPRRTVRINTGGPPRLSLSGQSTAAPASPPRRRGPRRPDRSGGLGDVTGRGRPARPRSPRRFIGRALLGLLVLVIAAIVWFLIALFQPFGGSPGAAVEVSIPRETSTAQIARILHRDRVIGSSFFFRLRAELAGTHVRAGDYALARSMTYGAALSVLGKGPQGPQTTNVTIIPGKSRYQLTQLLRSQGVTGDYSESTRHSRLLNPVRYGAPAHTPSLEGFLYPDTYNLTEPLSISALVADQLTQFKREMAQVNLTYAKSRNLSAYDVLIIASLEDAEAAKPGDLPKVASVIYNRLALGMDLGLDTTAAYAANNYSGNLTARQLASGSAWNTLKHTGLPPTPIDSPDITAIQAAAHPASTHDLYFIVKVCGNGALNFTANYNQFLTWSRQYSAAVAQRGATKTEFCSGSHGG